MEFPLFHLDFYGNRLLIGVIAGLHVVINHMLAVGALPLIALMEWWGWRCGDENWDRLAQRLLFVAFIVTTSLGAMTGVGIWLSASLVNPAAIGSLIRIFFWAWFIEWTVFVTEVALILIYFLTWRGWGQRHKRAHIGVGWALSVFSWATMAIVVAILGFQMDTGVWTVEQSFRAALLNPVYLPQLLFRTPLAMVTAGLFGLFLTTLFTRTDAALRARATRFLSVWTLAWTGPWLLGAWTYYQVVPEPMRANFGVALGGMRYETALPTLVWLIAAAVGLCLLVAVWGLLRPRRLPSPMLIVPGVLAIALLGTFERVREFVRKPDVIAAYMHANALRPAEYALYRERGLLPCATYAAVHEANDVSEMNDVSGSIDMSGVGLSGGADDSSEERRILAGREMFRLACSRCHTTRGVNGVVQKLARMYGARPWDAASIATYLAGMHNLRRFMPPVPGNDAERHALAAYLVALQERVEPLRGAQTAGAPGAIARP